MSNLFFIDDYHKVLHEKVVAYLKTLKDLEESGRFNSDEWSDTQREYKLQIGMLIEYINRVDPDVLLPAIINIRLEK
jgi:hypothetical protein